MNAASAIRLAFFSFMLLTVSTSRGEIVSYSDKGLASSYEGLSFSTGTYPSATYKDSDGVTHSTVWLTDTDCPTSLTSLAAGLGETSLKVYTMTDSVDGSRLAPQYDELLQLPYQSGAYIQCYPWVDSSPFGYSTISWEIDSWLWNHPEVLPVFSRGENASLGYVTTQASAFSVLAADDASAAAVRAFKLRQRYLSEGVPKPTGALVRAAYAVDADEEGVKTACRDRIPYAEGQETYYEIQVSASGSLVFSMAYVDPGSWGDFKEGSQINPAINLDLSVSVVSNGVPLVWSATRTNAAHELIAIGNAPAGTYLVRVIAVSAMDSSAEGGACALVVCGELSDGAELVPTTPVKLQVSVAGEQVGEVVPAAGSYLLPSNSVVSVTAADYAYLSEGGLPYARCPLTSSCCGSTVLSNAETSVSVSWSDEVSDYRVRTFALFDEMEETAVLLSDVWRPVGSSVQVSIPGGSPFGLTFVTNGITYRLSNAVWSYTDEWYFDPIATAEGAFVAETNLVVNAGLDLAFAYWNETETWYSDTIPQYWFQRHLMSLYLSGGETDDDADPDGDGFSNYEEYVANTDPIVREDRFAFTSISPNSISFRGGKDRTVRLQSTDSLSNPVWKTVQTLSPSASSTVHPIVSQPGCFYRLQVE